MFVNSISIVKIFTIRSFQWSRQYAERNEIIVSATRKQKINTPTRIIHKRTEDYKRNFLYDRCIEES